MYKRRRADNIKIDLGKRDGVWNGLTALKNGDR